MGTEPTMLSIVLAHRWYCAIPHNPGLDTWLGWLPLCDYIVTKKY